MKPNEIISMIAQILIGLGVIIGAIVFILRWCFNVNKSISKIETKLDALPLKIEGGIIKQLLPFATSVINVQNNPLPQEDIETMRRLMNKLQNSTITQQESVILKNFLEIEKEEAEKKNNSNLLLAIGIALSAIALLFAISSNEK
jgi:hypothetical protein